MKLFAALFVVNIVTWVPTIVIAVISAIIGHKKIPNSLSILQYLAYVSQPVLHPMLETCLFTRARTKVTKYLCCFCAKTKTLISTSAEVKIVYSSTGKRDSDSSTTSMTPLEPQSQYYFHKSFSIREEDCSDV